MTSIIKSKINNIEKNIIDELLKKEVGSLYQEIKIEWSFHWFQYIKDNPGKYSLDELSSNPNITWEIVQANPNILWDYDFLSMNPNITWEIVQANQDKKWYYNWLSQNPNITWEIVQANPEKDWNYMLLRKNDFIKKRLIECYKSHYSKVIKVHEELIAIVLKTENLGDNADEQVKRLEELGFDSDED